MLNKVILIGRLTKEVEVSALPSGMTVSKFTLAIDRRFQKQGEEKKTDFINIVSFGKLAEFCAKWFNKGQLVNVVGSIQTRSWDGQDGQKRYATEVIIDEANFCESKKEEQAQIQVKPQQLDGFVPLDDNDELPF